MHDSCSHYNDASCLKKLLRISDNFSEGLSTKTVLKLVRNDWKFELELGMIHKGSFPCLPALFLVIFVHC